VSCCCCHRLRHQAGWAHKPRQASQLLLLHRKHVPSLLLWLPDLGPQLLLLLPMVMVVAALPWLLQAVGWQVLQAVHLCLVLLLPAVQPAR
jgi:hypothetical protein